MHYKPLLLALMLCFAAPSFAAPESAKEKAAAKKTVKNTQATAAKDNKKTAAKKDSAKEKAAEKPAARNEKAKADSKKAEPKTAKEKDGKQTQAAKTEKTAANKAAGKKAEAVPAEKENSKTAAKSSKNTAKDSKTPEKAEKAAPAKNSKTAKAAEPEKKTATAKQAAGKDSGKDKKQTAAKAVEKPARAAANGDSEELRAAISAATNDLEDKKALNKRTEAFLVRVNANLKELQQARSSLSNINRQQRDAWDKFQKLNNDLNRLKTEVSNTRAQISRFVSGNYKNSQPNAVALFLKNAEPGQKTRFLRYTRYINAANEQVVKDLAKQQKELTAQENKINAELGRLKKLQAGLQAALKKQGATNTAEQVESRRQNAKIAQEAKKTVNQKDNEQRLNNLLSDLDKRKAEQQKREAEARKKAAEARLAAAEKARKAKAAEAAAEKKAAQERAALSNLTADDMKLQAPDSGSFTTVSNPNSFSRMQGRLKKPVNGILAGLFGQARHDGGVWKGVFYQTVPASVSSIAAGTVSYAAELEGYGKVVVIDHGDSYVSIYSGLSEIAVASGYSVGAGHKIGTSGTLPGGDEGLYLEIRYHGQNMNPLSWIN